MVLVQLNKKGCFELSCVENGNQFIKVGENILTIKYSQNDMPYVVLEGNRMQVTYY